MADDAAPQEGKQRASKLLRKLSTNLKNSFNTPRANSFSLQRMRSSSLGVGSPKADEAANKPSWASKPDKEDTPAKENVPQAPSATVTQAIPSKSQAPLGDAKPINTSALVESMFSNAVKDLPVKELPGKDLPDLPDLPDEKVEPDAATDKDSDATPAAPSTPAKVHTISKATEATETAEKKDADIANIIPGNKVEGKEGAGEVSHAHAPSGPSMGAAVPVTKSEGHSADLANPPEEAVNLTGASNAKKARAEISAAEQEDGKPGKPKKGLASKVVGGVLALTAAVLLGKAAHEHMTKEADDERATDLEVMVKRARW